MLDEPAAGLNHSEVRVLGDTMRRLRDEEEITILLVEHHMQLVMDVSDYVVALDFGRTLVEGTPAEVQADDRLIEAYLGGSVS
jgi:branched-chain amino acid transport system ATP-binding protein